MAGENEEFVAACEEARAALYRVLMLVEPDAGTKLRSAYGELKTMAAGQAPDGPTAQTRELPRDLEQEDEQRRQAWKHLTFYEREELILEHLGDERMTVGELTGRMRHALKVDFTIYESMIRAQVGRMFKAAQLQRDGEPWHGRIRYRYYRKRGLSGPIADLQAQFDEPDEDTDGRDAV